MLLSAVCKSTNLLLKIKLICELLLFAYYHIMYIIFDNQQAYSHLRNYVHNVFLLRKCVPVAKLYPEVA